MTNGPNRYYPRLETTLTCWTMIALWGVGGLALMTAIGADPPPRWGLATWWMTMGGVAGAWITWIVGLSLRVLRPRRGHRPEPRLNEADRKQLRGWTCEGAALFIVCTLVIDGVLQAVWVLWSGSGKGMTRETGGAMNYPSIALAVIWVTQGSLIGAAVPRAAVKARWEAARRTMEDGPERGLEVQESTHAR